MYKAIRTKIYPTKTQKQYFNRCFGIRRFAWNWGVQHWDECKSSYSLDKAWNHDETLKSERPYLYEVNSMVKQMAFTDLGYHYKKVYNKTANRPNFISKKKDINRFSMNEKTKKSQKTKTIMFNGKWINMNATRKLGRFIFKSAENLNFLNSEYIRVIQWTISERRGNYYISITYERTNHSYTVKKPKDKIGIDAGMKTMLTSWDGCNFSETNLPSKIIMLENKLSYYQSKMDKKHYNSYRYNLLKNKINKLYEQISNIKRDFICKEINFLTNTYKQINIETFDFRSALKYTKAGRKLFRLSISMFLKKLEIKCSENGNVLNVIKGEPTTQTCNKCGYRHTGVEKLTLRDRKFICKSCGHADGRDINASKNIYDSI